MRDSKINHTKVAMSKSHIWLLVFNNILQLWKLGLPEEMTDSRTGTGDIEDEPGVSYSTRKYKSAQTHTHIQSWEFRWGRRVGGCQMDTGAD